MVSTTETTGVTLFYANYGFTLEAYRPPYDSPNADNACIFVEDIIQLQEELKKGYDDNENSWVLERELKRNAQAILREFHQLINVIDGLGWAGNGRIRRQQGNLTSGLRFTFLALNPF
ncbi:hypothetical protein MKX08_007588 [Trichoderma sp. CBMAI-0020]|nr:hypothetical protein MKX08_007588 [Trichoderma sp. CBMAI-0020]